jgi:hypothetical protein
VIDLEKFREDCEMIVRELRIAQREVAVNASFRALKAIGADHRRAVRLDP